MTSDEAIAFNQGMCDAQEADGSNHNPYDRVWQPALRDAYERGRIEGMREWAQLNSRANEDRWLREGECPMPGTAPPDWTPDEEDIMNTRLHLRQATEYLISSTHWSPREAQEWIEQVARANKASLHQVAEAIVAQRMVGYHYDVPI